MQGFKRATTSLKTFTMHENCNTCDPDHVAHFYSVPLIVIVENAATDGEWLNMVARHLRPSLRYLLKLDKNMVDIRQAGGIGEIPKEIRRLATERSKIRPSGAPIRIVAIADSDAKVPGQPSIQANDVRATAAEHDVASHILSKRTIENYIPDSALKAYCNTRKDQKDAANLISTLTGPARDHYPVKAGLSQKELDATAIYPDDTPLEVGMGDFILDLLENFSWTIEGHELRARDGSAELDQVLDTLEENL